VSLGLRPPEPNFGHLIAMTDERGTFEHALYSEPRPEHGYCTDDMARVLVVATREPSGTPALRHLAVLSLRFLLEALEPQGKCRNRMNRDGTWDDHPALNDWAPRPPRVTTTRYDIGPFVGSSKQ
jgi:hypothetical protein